MTWVVIMISIKRCLLFRKTFSQSIAPFLLIEKVFGLASFRFPSTRYRHSRGGLICVVLNCILLVVILIIYIHNLIFLTYSVVLTTCLQIFAATRVFCCFLVLSSSFVLQGKYFLLLRKFEEFDRKIAVLLPNGVPMQKPFIITMLLWICKTTYLASVGRCFKGIIIAFLISFYQNFYLQLAQDQLMFSAYHLLVRLQTVNSLKWWEFFGHIFLTQ